MRNQILQGDALSVLRTLPDAFVQMVCTSPPYFGLRDYNTETILQLEGDSKDCNHEWIHEGRNEDGAKVAQCKLCFAAKVDHQIGLEETPEQYVQKLVEVFREVKRVLRDDGTVWLNLGDSYVGSNMGHGGDEDHGKLGKHAHVFLPEKRKLLAGLKPKNLIGIPWRVALALQADGWILRQDIIWEKPNCMPESVTDRCTKSHEYVFLLAKQERYFYDSEAIKEKAVKGSQNAGARNYLAITDGAKRYRLGQTEQTAADGRNKRSVWSIPTVAFPDSHFAVMSPELARTCILAGSATQACEHCGKAWKRITEKIGEIQDRRSATNRYAQEIGGTHTERTTRRIMDTIGFIPACKCPDTTGSGKSIVLDCFSGAGTTALVASQLNRDYLGIELNPEYVAMSKRRLSNDMGLWESLLNPEVA